MSGIAHHLVRRGLEATHQQLYQGSVENADDGDNLKIKFPVWGIAMLWVTFLLFIFTQFIVSNRYGLADSECV